MMSKPLTIEEFFSLPLGSLVSFAGSHLFGNLVLVIVSTKPGAKQWIGMLVWRNKDAVVWANRQVGELIPLSICDWWFALYEPETEAQSA